MGEFQKIEITPEMIEAGVDALSVWEPHHDPSLVVSSVYQAMTQRLREKGPPHTRRPLAASRP